MRTSQLTALFVSIFLATSLTACKHKGDGTNKARTATGTQVTDDRPPEPQPKPSGKTPKRYDVESGIVTYKVSGTMMEGTETLYFDNYGMIEAKYTNLTMNVPGAPEGVGDQEQLVVMKDGKIYSINLLSRTGTETADSITPQIMERLGKEDMVEVGKEVMKLMNGVEKGNDNVGGYDCTVWSLPTLGSNNCVHKGVTLRAETNLNGLEMLYEAEEVQFNVPVPADKLAIPSDINFSAVNTDDLMQMIEGL